MWTSSILVFISMVSTQAAKLDEQVRKYADEVRASQLVDAERLVTAPVAAAPVATTSVAANSGKLALAKAPTPPAAAPSMTPAAPAAPNYIGGVVSPELMAPNFDAPLAIGAHLDTPHTAIKVPVPTKAQDVVGKVQHFYNTTKSFTASFSQTVTNSTFSKLGPKKSSGKVYILKPGKMRWDYKNDSARSKKAPKASKSFISDGKHLWAVMHKNKQYYKESLSGSALPVAVSFLMGTGNLLNDFNVVLETPGKYGSKNDILLLLTPKVPSARYKKLWLVVDPSNHSVKESVVLNSKGDTNRIVFSDVVLDSGKLRPGHFIFNAAANKDYSLIKPPKQ